MIKLLPLKKPFQYEHVVGLSLLSLEVKLIIYSNFNLVRKILLISKLMFNQGLLFCSFTS